MNTLGTLFTGFGGFDLGAHAAGLQSAWGVEYDAAIAEVAQTNGLPVTVMNVLDADPRKFERVDWFHASPPCTRASTANSSAELNDEGLKESPLDIALAEKTAEFIRVLQPPTVSLENVYGYRKFKAFKLLMRTLTDCGYMMSAEHINAADYGVPQTRRRLIVRATKAGLIPPMPEPVPWVGWYAAIEDIIDTLPESQFADWQLKRLPETIKNSRLFNFRDTGFDQRAMSADEPSCTIRATEWRPSHWLAFLVDNQNASREATAVMSNEPSFSIASGAMRRPANTPSAWLVESRNSNQQYGDGMRAAAEPATTVTTDGKPSHQPKGWLSRGRVVRMTPRALARFQTFPDSYQLPNSATLACTGIGNAVPWLLAQRIVESHS